MYEQPTEEELASLEVGSTDIKPPSPQVAERADRIIDQLVSGEAFSTEGGPSPAGRLPYDDADKLEFITHLLGGQPFVRSYDLLGGAMTLTFSSIDAATNLQLARMAAAEQSAPARRLRYNAYLMAASLTELRRRGEPPVRCRVFEPGGTEESWRKAHDAWAAGMPREQYLVVRSAYQQFAALLSGLLEKVDSPDFWPTPS